MEVIVIFRVLFNSIWLTRCARVNRPGIYTNVSALADWIRLNTEDGDCSKYIWLVLTGFVSIQVFACHEVNLKWKFSLWILYQYQYKQPIILLLVAKKLSERFGCEAKLREACLALLDLVCFQSDLGDVRRLVRELFVKAACIAIGLQLGHIRRSHLSLERTQLKSDHMRWFRNLSVCDPVCAVEVRMLLHFFGSTYRPNPFCGILNLLALKEAGGTHAFTFTSNAVTNSRDSFDIS